MRGLTGAPRYDGQADWYDDYNAPAAERNRADVVELLGPGDGLCLDLGCGTGHYRPVIEATGRTVVGLDRSMDQLRLARRRGGCTQNTEDGGTIVHPNYQDAGWHHSAPWWGQNIRARVGMRHVPLGEFLTAFPAAGLRIDRVTELGDRPVPYVLAVRATRA